MKTKNNKLIINKENRDHDFIAFLSETTLWLFAYKRLKKGKIYCLANRKVVNLKVLDA